MQTALVLDTESKSSYTFTLTVGDGTNSDAHSITITATDVNEYAPVCDPAAYFSNLDEDVGSGKLFNLLYFEYFVLSSAMGVQ